MWTRRHIRPRRDGWRFVEIVDGETLPASFAACAARALGGGYRLAPPDGLEFPSYRGELQLIYTIPAPAVDSRAGDEHGSAVPE